MVRRERNGSRRRPEPRRTGRDERHAKDCSRLVCSRLLGETLSAACRCAGSFLGGGGSMSMPGGRVRGSWGRSSLGPYPQQEPARQEEERLVRFEFEETHMASPFKIVLYSTDQATARRASREAFNRIAELDRILSDYDPESELSKLSGTAGKQPVQVSAPLFDVLTLSRRAYDRSDGAFDVTIAAPSAGSGGGPAASGNCRIPRSWPRPGSWWARTAWCSTLSGTPCSCKRRA